MRASTPRDLMIINGLDVTLFSVLAVEEINFTISITVASSAAIGHFVKGVKTKVTGSPK